MFKGWKRATASSTLVVEIFTKEILSKIDEKGMDKCFGQMDHSIKENGEMEYKMEKDKFIYQAAKLWVVCFKIVF